MTTIKKRFMLFLSLMLCLAFTASCNNNSSNTSSAESSKATVDSETASTVSTESSEDTIGGDMQKITSFPMTFEKESDLRYNMTCESPDKNTLSLSFIKKSWGTYNIGGWSVTDKNGSTVNLTGESTDWEYVFRSGETSSSWVWSGGNHENELLIDLKFYNGEDGTELNLTDGASVKLNNIKIVEKTKLHWGDTSKTYCDVTRTYTIAGNQISLDASFEYTKDCYHWLSYSCMFPVDKKYGLYCSFVTPDDKLIKTVETLKVGAADYSGKQYRGNAADRCIIWGYEKPEYKFDIKVDTVTDSCEDFKNQAKTFYWDMNTTHNKLYFSKYEENTPTLVKSGTKLNTKSTWTFFIG